jgi:RNA polymerase sigma-70 factor (ECF subfamily)
LSSQSDEQIIKGYVEGTTTAYHEVNRWIQAVVDSRHWGLGYQREDILQEVHKRLFENLSQNRFRAGSSLKTYVFQISKYTCIEFLRRKIRSSSVDVDLMGLRDNTPGPEQELASAEWTEKATEAVASLPENCRKLFEMIFIESLPYQEIGRKLGVAEGTVKSRTWRCREQLAKILRRKGVDPS